MSIPDPLNTLPDFFFSDGYSGPKTPEYVIRNMVFHKCGAKVDLDVKTCPSCQDTIRNEINFRGYVAFSIFNILIQVFLNSPVVSQWAKKNKTKLPLRPDVNINPDFFFKVLAEEKFFCPITKKNFHAGAYLYPCGHVFNEKKKGLTSEGKCFECKKPVLVENIVKAPHFQRAATVAIQLGMAIFRQDVLNCELPKRIHYYFSKGYIDLIQTRLDKGSNIIKASEGKLEYTPNLKKGSKDKEKPSPYISKKMKESENLFIEDSTKSVKEVLKEMEDEIDKLKREIKTLKKREIAYLKNEESFGSEEEIKQTNEQEDSAYQQLLEKAGLEIEKLKADLELKRKETNKKSSLEVMSSLKKTQQTRKLRSEENSQSFKKKATENKKIIKEDKAPFVNSSTKTDHPKKKAFFIKRCAWKILEKLALLIKKFR